MGARDKRARKKQHRDAQLQARVAAMRRRRTARVVGVLVALGVVFALAIFTVDDEEPETGPGAQSTEEPAESPEPPASPTERPSEAACGAEPPPPGDPQQYDAPADVLEDGVDYAAVMDTSCGEIRIDLLEEQAPETVNNFVFLAQEGYYDGVIFHRVERDFVIQAGDPNGRSGEEPDGPGYTIPDELPDEANDYVFGVLAMANAGPNSGGSQFFFVTHDAPTEGDKKTEPAGLTPSYAIFGEADPASYEVLDRIQRLKTVVADDPAQSVQPADPVYINSIEILER